MPIGEQSEVGSARRRCIDAEYAKSCSSRRDGSFYRPPRVEPEWLSTLSSAEYTLCGDCRSIGSVQYKSQIIISIRLHCNPLVAVFPSHVCVVTHLVSCASHYWMVVTGESIEWGLAEGHKRTRLMWGYPSDVESF